MRNHLHALCPYFAMFPASFAESHVETFTEPDEYVFDPFCGRGTTVLQSLLMGRNAAGCDVNPVAYCVSDAKAKSPSCEAVGKRLDSLERLFADISREDLSAQEKALPTFFKWAYHSETLRCLLFLRGMLDWRDDEVDRFIAALILGSLHGEMDRSSAYFSNQMPRTISTKPEYSISYWRARSLHPPRRLVFDMLRQKAAYRLNMDPPSKKGSVAMIDVRDSADVFKGLHGKIKAFITSPPYLNVTRYEEDQWLRLWFLGREPKPKYRPSDDRHVSPERYWEFLSDAWEGIAPLAARSCVLVCRLAAKNISRNELNDSLYDSLLTAFPRAYPISSPKISKIRRRQTGTFQPKAKGCFFEIDYVFRLT
jgi:hypothetical protein